MGERESKRERERERESKLHEKSIKNVCVRERE